MLEGCNETPDSVILDKNDSLIAARRAILGAYFQLIPICSDRERLTQIIEDCTTFGYCNGEITKEQIVIQTPWPPKPLRYKDIILNPHTLKVQVGQERVKPVTFTENNFLAALIYRAPEILTFQGACDAIYPGVLYEDDMFEAMKIHISRLRGKLDNKENPSHINTIRRVGWALR